MKSYLFSYSEVETPLYPKDKEYIVGIIESEDKSRTIAFIDNKFRSSLDIGIEGILEKRQMNEKEVCFFIPRSDENDEPVFKKVALITGSSKGIGKAIAFELAKIGYDIIVNNSSNTEEGLAVAKEITKMGRESIYFCADISKYDDVKHMFDRSIKKFGKIDVLVNNAGITRDKTLKNMDNDKWEEVISINLTGTFFCTKLIAQHMIEHQNGKIINIASVIGQIGNIGQSNYSASKGGIIAFTKSVAKELAKYNITVNAIAPGFVKTDMVDAIPQDKLQNIINQIPLKRLAKPEEIAKLVKYLVSDDANYITGQTININGGFYM